jgi:hypothetical protein
MALGRKIAIYCSDVSGAFDRVRAERLVAKLHAWKVDRQIITVIKSWLRQRTANIVVGGEYSEGMKLLNMVFQGTVLGPMLWNMFFEDARRAIKELFFTEAVYADDLNAYREFSSQVSDETVKGSIDICQKELHTWGKANQVEFDPAKESKHVLQLAQPEGSSFKLLGVVFDDGLIMEMAVTEVVNEASWKLRTLLRTRRYYTDADLITLYKAHMLSFLEYRTPAIYHALRSILSRLDSVQSRFLRSVGVDDLTALVDFKLAPLAVRRDIAMLGLIHRAAVGKGPSHFKKFFRRRSGGPGRNERQLEDPRTASTHPVVKRSALGLVAVYNMLPAAVVETSCISAFQKKLQELVIARATEGCEDWQATLSPRVALDHHPLR